MRNILQFFAIFKAIFTIILMDLALGQNDHYHRYISAILEGLLCITAKLIKMVQYHHPPIL